MRRFIVALVAVLGGLVGPSAVVVVEAPAAHAEVQIIKWWCDESSLSGGYWMPTKSWRGCPEGRIIAYNINAYPPKSDPTDGWDGQCTDLKSIAQWTDAHIRSYCRLREFGGQM